MDLIIAEVHQRYGRNFVFDERIDLQRYNPDVAHCLDTIYEMKRYFTAKDLTEASHKEDPWKQAKPIGSKITDEALRMFFSQPEQCLEYLLASTFQASYTGQHLRQSLFEFKKFISTQNDQSFLVITRDRLTSLEDSTWQHLEPLETQDPFFTRIRWPHQSFKESVLGYLFFPQELIDLYEVPISLYRREVVRYTLAYSAQYNHPMALQHMASLLELECNFPEEEEEEERELNTDDPLIRAAQQFSTQATEYFRATSQDATANSFLRAKSFLTLGDGTNAKTFFEQTIVPPNPQDEEALYWLGVLSRDDRSVYYIQAAAAGYGKARLHQAKIAPTREQSFQLYLASAHADIVEGWYNLAQLVEQSVVLLAVEHNDSIFYLEEAGQRGMLTAYSFAADLIKKKGDLNQAKTFLQKQGDGGNPQGYYDLAKILESEGNGAEALTYYQKAGPLLGREEAIALTEQFASDTADQVRQELDHNYQTHLTELIKISANQEDQIDVD